jgi:hypothetical protein
VGTDEREKIIMKVSKRIATLLIVLLLELGTVFGAAACGKDKAADTSSSAAGTADDPVYSNTVETQVEPADETPTDAAVEDESEEAAE